MHELIRILLAREGTYEGRGTNHEDEAFRGRLVLMPAAGGAGVEVRYAATGDDGTVYHTERTLIGPKTDGGVALWTASSNAPTFAEYALRSDESSGVGNAGRQIVFGHGDPTDRKVFRSEIRIALDEEDGSLGYHHAWGLPEAEFGDRSGVRMVRVGE